PVLAPPGRAETTLHRFVHNKTLNNTIDKFGQAAHKRSKNHLPQYLTANDIFTAFFFYPKIKNK
ncbi:hypothetical protein, partial [Enterobacter hormaechei]